MEGTALIEELTQAVRHEVKRAVAHEVKKAVDDALNPVRKEVAEGVEELVSASLCSLKEDLTTLKIAHERSRQKFEECILYLACVRDDLDSIMKELRQWKWRRY